MGQAIIVGLRGLKLSVMLAVSTHLTADEAVKLSKGLASSLNNENASELTKLEIQTNSYQTCLPCHGPNAEGNPAQRAPALAGQHRWYLERQLDHFRTGIRGTHEEDIHGAAMRAIAMLLNDSDDQASILDEIEAFPLPHLTSVLEGDLQAGAERYNMSCANCHGEHAEGIEKFDAPRLNTLQDWYLVRQLKKFQKGYRGEHKGDTTGQEMRPMAMAVYTEKELADVATYIMSLGNSDGAGYSETTK